MNVPEHNLTPTTVTKVVERNVFIFGSGVGHRDERTIESFGDEWERFNTFDEAEIERTGDEYFDIVPKELLGPHVKALDLGCGSGRWTRYLSKRVGHVDAVDPSQAVMHAALRHQDLTNVRWNQAGVDNIPFAPGQFDLVICLGVLHHVPGTAEALAKLAKQVRPGGHLLIYLYYALDGRGPLFKALFGASALLRRVISSLPKVLKHLCCDVIAYSVYVPLKGLAVGLRSLGYRNWRALPLSYYHDKSLTILRNDALDRFGTPLEQRFTRQEIQRMMQDAQLKDIRFSEEAPYWHALGERA
jgi:2-polyprenyl-3-methyl-5-hydroxy-6-metoxy-1,4-benzoquinol methylase